MKPLHIQNARDELRSAWVVVNLRQPETVTRLANAIDQAWATLDKLHEDAIKRGVQP